MTLFTDPALPRTYCLLTHEEWRHPPCFPESPWQSKAAKGAARPTHLPLDCAAAAASRWPALQLASLAAASATKSCYSCSKSVFNELDLLPNPSQAMN